MKLVSIVVPCYNEHEVLPILYDALKKEEANLIDKYDFEYIFVNDGSKDDTLKVLMDLANKDSKVKYLSFSKNFGKENAMYAGFKASKGDLVTIMDSDMQDPPFLLPKMLEILESDEYDSVATYRQTRKGEPKLRSFFANKFYNIMNKISDTNMKNGARDYRLMKRPMVDAIIRMTEYDRFSKGIFGWIGFNTYWLPFENVERAAGKTKWSFFKLFKYSIKGITDFSYFPLILPFIASFITFIAFALFLATAIVQRCVDNQPLLGWYMMAALISFFTTFVMLAIGIQGLYIQKTHNEVKGRPHYIVSRTNIEDLNRLG